MSPPSNLLVSCTCTAPTPDFIESVLKLALVKVKGQIVGVPYLEGQSQQIRILQMRGDDRPQNFLCELEDTVAVATGGSMTHRNLW